MTTPDPSETGVDVAGGQYVENPDFVPDTTAATGTLDTSGTAGAADSKIENTTPVFDAAKAQDLQYAAKALDPDDKSVDDPGAVVNEGTTTTTTTSGRTVEEGEEAVKEAAEAYREDPVVVQDPTIQQAEDNAESGESTDPAKVQSEQQQASPLGGNTLDTSDNSGAANAQESATTDTTTDTPAKKATAKKK